MSYTVSIFTNLIQQYPSWQELRTFLQSEAGGQLRIIEPSNFQQFVIIRYVKGQSDMYNPSKPWVSWFRSVVWNTVTNRPVCVAPQKAMKSEPPSNTNLCVEEFLEGVMVNAFVDNNTLQWSTRSMLGAGSGFYGKQTFAEMITNAEKEQKLDEIDITKTLQSNGFTFASFVLQHPSHCVVQHIQKPNLTFIHLGKVTENGDVVISFREDWPELLQQFAVKTYPPLREGETPAERVDTMSHTSERSWQGLVFRGSNGERWRIRNVGYTILREIRGKESVVEERFTRIRSQGIVRLYLQHWPEDQQIFTELENRVRECTTNIYREYCAHHKEKSKTFMDIPVVYRTPVYELHGIYLNNLRSANKTLKMPVVIQYINSMNSETLATILRRTAVVV